MSGMTIRTLKPGDEVAAELLHDRGVTLVVGIVAAADAASIFDPDS